MFRSLVWFYLTTPLRGGFYDLIKPMKRAVFVFLIICASVAWAAGDYEYDWTGTDSEVLEKIGQWVFGVYGFMFHEEPLPTEYGGFYDWAGILGFLFVIVGLMQDIVERRLSRSRFLETLSSLFTQIPFYFTETFVFIASLGFFFVLYEYMPWRLPFDSWAVFVLAVIAADFAYYWEHRLSHRIRLFWLAHAVHHSSPIMNVAVAFRFSIFDPFIAAIFHLPLILLGFHPVHVAAGEIIVLGYQTWIHNETIGKLGFLEKILNTPSAHRVHHGSDGKYLDKNYGGMFIVWDRWFGTYQEEEETPRYGLTEQIDTVNPFKVQFSEFPRLWRDIRRSKTAGEFAGYLFRPPGWKPRERK